MLIGPEKLSGIGWIAEPATHQQLGDNRIEIKLIGEH